jgi:hypothetical protein
VKYAVTAKEYFATLSISKLESPENEDALEFLPVPDLEEYERTKVHGIEVLYFTYPNHENPSVYVWLTEDEQYRYSFEHGRSRDKTLDETIPLLETLMTKKSN